MIFKPEEEKVKLTPEEAKQKLKELTDKARLAKKEREEADALEREKMRMKSGKQMVDAKQKGDEAAMKRKVELDRIEKEQDAAYKKRVLDEMRRDRNERFGIKEEEGDKTESIAKKVELPKYTKMEQIELQCEQVKVGNSAYPEKSRVFFETANLYVNNIIKNNGEEKFRKINQENKAFQSRILEAFGGCETLNAIGYEEQGTFLVMKDFDLK